MFGHIMSAYVPWDMIKFLTQFNIYIMDLFKGIITDKLLIVDACRHRIHHKDVRNQNGNILIELLAPFFPKGV